MEIMASVVGFFRINAKYYVVEPRAFKLLGNDKLLKPLFH